VLTKNGYQVVTAATGKEALGFLGAHRDEIALLLTDVILPGLSGKEISKRSGLPTLFMSGYTDEVIAQHGILGEGERLIQKPFDPESMLRTIREVIETHPRTGVPSTIDLSAAEPRTGFHVLVVEDDPSLRDLLRLVLLFDDDIEEVSVASTLSEALVRCMDKPPDVIVTDSVLGGVDDVSPGERLKAELPLVPIISFSGREQDRPWADLHISKSGKGLDRVVEAVREIAVKGPRRRVSDS
jgi:DNA-binding response OmpR family regulator